MANTHTAVPLFVANQVLTAAQQNISAGTGVPVFATTVTRDAAFGGSNKALAEGQLCYLEDSNIVQYYTGAAWATVGPTSAGVVQVKSTTVTASTFSTSSSSLVDITGLSVSITPTSASNKILIMSSLSCGISVSGELPVYSFARGGVAIAQSTGGGSQLGTLVGYNGINSASYNYSSQFLDSPATTAATTYNVRVKALAGGYTFYLNRRGTSDQDNSISTITVMEVTP